MSDPLYNITFQGKLLYGYEQDEVRNNLAKLTKFDEQMLNRLFSGEKVVLKKELDLATAERYKEVLDKTGARCEVVLLCKKNNTPDETEKLLPEETHGTTCPKCGATGQAEESCARCGILFSKYRQRQEQIASGQGRPAPASHNEASYFDEHQEQLFILKAFAVIVGIICLQSFLSSFIGLFMLLFPVIFLFYVKMQATVEDRSATEVLAEHITFMPVMYTTGEKRKEDVAVVTYSLILVNILIFYLYEINTDPEFLVNNLLFLPLKPNAWNTPFSIFSYMFLHASGAHLWGNMLFLWAVGTVVEKRIGWKRYLAFYLLSGMSAAFVSLFIHLVFLNTPVHVLGASGAIAGIMGIYAVRCYFKSMVFPLPILGIFSLILPVSLKVRLNALVIIGLFFLADLSGGIGQLTGKASMIGHWTHIGGMLGGIGLATFFKLSRDAFKERHLEIGSTSVHGQKLGINTEAGEDSLRLVLKDNPQDVEALLLLAQLKSKYSATDEGAELYPKAISLLIKDNRLPEAATAFLDFYRIYLKGVAAKDLYRLAGYFNQHNELEHAGTCLELLCKDSTTPHPILEKSLYQYGRLLDIMGFPEAAAEYFQKVMDQFPESPFSEKLQYLKQNNSL
ncbi:rhomboid family intramembrane serine protease [Desulfuromonas acetoxidans]|uniref:rhomboid family intramembrane serine protease n=1 Tax=Desulfuromonas acetoxidans TaxID=891 RepID=UPI00292DD746|nr:rhomboid family intramembrane serine protease [Desulfuromonas acetoxidans]